MSRPNGDVISLFGDYPNYLNRIFLSHYPISCTQIERHEKSIDWNAISCNASRNWTHDFIKKFQDKLNWSDLSNNIALPWSELFFETYKNKFNRLNICSNPALPWTQQFILKHKQYWSFHYLVLNPAIPWTQEMVLLPEVIDKNLMCVNGDGLWSEEFLLKNAKILPWEFLCANPYIPWSEDLIDQLTPFWNKLESESSASLGVSPWKGLCSNPAVPWNSKLIEKYNKLTFREHGIHWDSLSQNPNLPWQEEELLEKYLKHWNWEWLSVNNGIGFTEQQIDDYKDLIQWQAIDSSKNCISLNTNLTWSSSFIKKHQDKWDWWLLSRNCGIHWDEALISEFEGQIRWSSLLNNPNSPWSLEFIMKHLDKIEPEWQYGVEPRDTLIWEKVFKPFVTDDVAELVLKGMDC